MLVFVGVIIFLLVTSISLSKISRLPASYFFPISIFLAVIFTTVFGLFDRLLLGAFLLLPVSFLAFIFLVGNELKTDPKVFFKKYLNFPVLIFIGLAYFTFIHSRQMQFYEWDEFSHWGPIVKSMYMFNALGIDSPILLNNPNYPPALSVFAYLVARLEAPWNEANVFWAYQLIFLAVITTLISKLKIKDFIYSVIIFLTAIFGTLYFYNVLQSVYADPLLSVIFGYTLALAGNSKKSPNRWHNFIFFTSIMMLVLVKDFGIVLALISIVLFGIVQIFPDLYNKDLNFKKLFAKFLLILSCVLIAFGTRFIWGLYTNTGNLKESTQVALANSPSNFASLFSNFDSRSRLMLQNFTQKFYEAPVSYVGGVPLTSSRWLIVLTIFLLIYLLSFKSFDFQFYSELVKSSIVIGGAFVYLFALYVAYLTAYSGDYALSLPSFERYVNTYFSGVMFYVVSKSSEQLSSIREKQKSQKSPTYMLGSTALPNISIAILIFASIYSPSGYFFNYLLRPHQQAEAIRANFQGIKQKIEFANFDTQDKVGIIAQHTVGFEYYVLQYEIMPASTVQTGYYTWSIGSPSGPDDVWTDTTMNSDRWNEYLNSLDYLIIYSVTDSFIEEFGSFFEDPESAYEQGIYRVVSTGDQNRLVKFI